MSDADAVSAQPTVEELMGRLRAIQLYQVRMDFIVPTSDPLAAMQPFLRDHILWLRDHEVDGSLFLSGANRDEVGWDGGGLAFLRAPSRAIATQIAESEPFHRAGLRRNTVTGWLLNEGNLRVSLNLFSDTYILE